MQNIGSYLFWALAACTLLHGSFAEFGHILFLRGNEGTSPDGTLQALQSKLEGKMMKLENQLQEVLNKIENLRLAVSNKCDGHEQEAKVGVPDLVRNTVPPGFERIGTRYFRLGEELVNWDTAKEMCREMGGYLASFQSEEEFTTVTTTLSNKTFWLGINDHIFNGHFVSVASHKQPKYLNWFYGKPSNDYMETCVLFQDGKMWNKRCGNSEFFLCQADNET